MENTAQAAADTIKIQPFPGGKKSRTTAHRPLILDFPILFY